MNILQLIISNLDSKRILAILAISALLLIHPVLHISWVERAPDKSARCIRGSLAILAMLAALTIFGKMSWPPTRRHELNAKEQKRFEQPLRDFAHPHMSIHLYCAPQDEINCQYAASLIPLFGEAGWEVANVVDRVALGKPKAGILIGMHGNISLEDEAKMKWNQGEWTLTPDEEWAVREAFVNIGIEPDSISGAAVPENQINIFVGHEREDESAPTLMTREFENWKAIKLEHPETNKKPGAK